MSVADGDKFFRKVAKDFAGFLLEAKMEVERQTMEAEWLQMFEYMRGVYAAIGQPPPPMLVPPPQPAPNTVSGAMSRFTTL